MDFPLLTDAKAIIIKYLASFGLEPVGASTQEILRVEAGMEMNLMPCQKGAFVNLAAIQEKSDTMFFTALQTACDRMAGRAFLNKYSKNTCHTF